MTTRVIIAGGGFGGLESAFSLKNLLKRSSEIILINRSTYHSFIPSIHLIVSGRVKAEEIRIPLNVVLGTAGIQFIQNEIDAVEPEKREVITDRMSLAYDYLVLSSGAESNFFDIPGAEDFSYRFRTAEDAGRIRTALLRILEDVPQPCSIIVAGAGTEGVEVIGELIDLIRAEARKEELKSGRISIKLIEGKKQLLPGFPLEVQNRVADYLRRQGVTLIAGDGIAEVARNSVVLTSGKKHDASIVIWTGGIQPSRLIRDLPAAKDPWGWLKVSDRLHVPDDERIYGIGDAVSIYTEDGPLALPRLAYHAQDQARVAALNILYHVQGKKQIRYIPKNRPRLISLGKEMGVLTTDDRVYSGHWVVSLKKALERKHLMSSLSQPVSSSLFSTIPGMGILYRLRTKLPV